MDIKPILEIYLVIAAREARGHIDEAGESLRTWESQ